MHPRYREVCRLLLIAAFALTSCSKHPASAPATASSGSAQQSSVSPPPPAPRIAKATPVKPHRHKHVPSTGAAKTPPPPPVSAPPPSEAPVTPSTAVAPPGEGRVAEVSGNDVIVTLGAPAGALVGSQLTISHPLRTVTDPATGKVLRSTESSVGDLKVTSSDAHSATGAFSGATPPRVGDIVRLHTPDTELQRLAAAQMSQYTALRQAQVHSQQSNALRQSQFNAFDQGLGIHHWGAIASTTPSTLQIRQNGCIKLRVFYATDRNPGPPSAKGVTYGPDENPADTLSYGSLVVSIPPTHTPGNIESPSIWKLEVTEDPARHIVLERVAPQSQEDFFNTLHATIGTTPRKEAFVFIHGYNVTFEDAARRAAQLSYDLQFAGAPILYSWPSRGTLSGYNADEESVQWTTPHLMAFLEDVHNRSGAATIHLIAHSMGNRALLNALEIMMREKDNIHFGQVVLAAPDVARSHFVQQIPLVRSAADHITLYASSKDQALAASQHINHYPRAGQTGDLTIIPPVETIDASAVVSGFLGHSYFGDSVLVLSDMLFLMRDGLPAARRSHLRQNYEGANIYWTFFP